MGEGSRSPHFYPCHHLAQWAGSVHGEREQVTTFLPLSPFSTEVWASSWGKGVGHHIFTLVTIYHRGLGHFMGEGSKSLQFYARHHLAQKAVQVHGGREQVTTIVPLSPFSTEVWASLWEREVGHHIFYLVTIQHTGPGQFSTEVWVSSCGKGVGHHIFNLVTNQHRGLGKLMGERSRSPQFQPCHHLAQRSGQVHGGRGLGHHIFILVTIQHRGLSQFMGEGSRSPHFYPCHHLAQRAERVHGGRGVGHHIFTLVTIQHRELGKFMGGGSTSPHFYPCHY